MFATETEQTIQLILQSLAVVGSMVCIVLWLRDREIMPNWWHWFGLMMFWWLFLGMLLMDVRRITAWARFRGSDSPFIASLDLATIPMVISVCILSFTIMFAIGLSKFILLVKENRQLVESNVLLDAKLAEATKKLAALAQ